MTAVEPFDAVDVIRAKRDGGVVPEDALRWMVDAYTREYVADSQMAAFAMAVLLNGMTRDEIRVMTDAMIASSKGSTAALSGRLEVAGGCSSATSRSPSSAPRRSAASKPRAPLTWPTTTTPPNPSARPRSRPARCASTPTRAS